MRLDDPERGNPLRWVLIAGVLVVVLVAGVLIVMTLVGGKDGADPDSPSAQTDDPSRPQFAAEPVFDSYGRVVYVPKDAPHGVALTTTLTTDTSRPATQKPDGVLLQKVNGDMVLPFSAADGPTGFTPTGVATGFSHTPQGAALAAIHYWCWTQKLRTDTDRLKALIGQNIVDDDNVLREVLKNPPAGSDSDHPCTPGTLKVDYHPVLTKVHLGYNAIQKDGTETKLRISIPLEWRDGGWILKLHTYGKDEARGYYGSSLEFRASEGWVSWFAR